MTVQDPTSYALTLSCPDRPGIVHAVSGALLEAGGNIVESQQYGSPAAAKQQGRAEQPSGRFFMRVEVATSSPLEPLRGQLAPVAAEFGMEWTLHPVGAPVRTLIMASKEAHCLNELLFQQRSGTLPITVPAIVSNHPELAEMAAFYGVPFHHVPVASKAEAEQELRRIIEDENIELVVLARYMQILSDELCRDLTGRAINIHHSFLPSFKGARPMPRPTLAVSN